MNLEETIKKLKEGYKIRKKGWDRGLYIRMEMEGDFIFKKGEILLVDENMNVTGGYATDPQYWNLEDDVYEIYSEESVPLLTKEEKKYIINIIEPVRDNVKYVSKLETAGAKKEYIFIDTGDTFSSLFAFEKDMRFKGLKVNKKYTLEELFMDDYDKELN